MSNIQYYEHLCLCGCGGKIEVKKHHKWINIPKYLNGHGTKGIKKSEEEKIIISNTIKNQYRNGREKSLTIFKKGHIINKGSKRTGEQIKNISDSHIGQIPWNKGIPSTEETKQKQSKVRKEKELSKGKNNPNWNNGSSFEIYPQEFFDIRKYILERDNYSCQDPNCLKKSIKLDCHHIDYDKKNNNLENIIILCHSCHSKTNGKNNRQYFTEFYQNIMMGKLLECLI